MLELNLEALSRLILPIHIILPHQVILSQIPQMLLILQQLLSLLIHPKLHVVIIESPVKDNSQEVLSILVGVAVGLFDAFEEVDP